MRKKTNIIEINGKRYDAGTGVALLRGSAKTTAGVAVPKPVAAKPAHRAVTRPAGPHNLSRAPAPASTLMRQAVHKPAAGSKPHFRAYGEVGRLIEPPQPPVAFKPSVRQLDEQRLRHAEQIRKSQVISRFSAVTATDNSPVFQAPPSPAARPAPRPPAVPRPGRTAAPGKHAETTADLLARAVQQAQSHRQPLAPKPSNGRAKRNVGIGATVALAVVVLGLIVSQNLSSVRLQTASAKAGFSASLPNYRPAGYSLGQLSYATGVVSVAFHSNSDGRSYTVTQKPSSWDSSALRNNFVVSAAAGGSYQTVTAGQQTLYIYGQGNATWVNGGIWYIVQSDGSLSDRQLVDLATSL